MRKGKDKSGAIGVLSGKYGTHAEERGVFFCALIIGKRRKRGGTYMEEGVASGLFYLDGSKMRGAKKQSGK